MLQHIESGVGAPTILDARLTQDEMTFLAEYESRKVCALEGNFNALNEALARINERAAEHSLLSGKARCPWSHRVIERHHIS